MKQQDIDSLTQTAGKTETESGRQARRRSHRRSPTQTPPTDLRFQCIRRLLADVDATSDADAIAGALCRAVVEELRFEDCSAYLFNAAEGVYEQRFAHGPENPNGQQMLIPIRVAPGQGLIGSVALTAQSELIYADEGTGSDRSGRRYQHDRYASRLVVPIVHNDRVVGIIDSQDHKRRFHTEAHREVLETIAEIVAMYLSTDETRQQLQQTLDGLEAARVALAADEQRSRFFEEEHPAMFVVVDGLGAIKLVNRQLASHLGYSVDELIGRTLADCCPDASHAQVIDYLSYVLRSADPVPPMRQALMDSDGTPSDISLQGKVVNFEGDLDSILLIVEPTVVGTQSVESILQEDQDTDPLTGLANADRFYRSVLGHVDQARLSRASVSIESDLDSATAYGVVGYVNVDQLTALNDACGQSAGDELLVQLSDLILRRLRRTDYVARLGGDRFAVMMPGCTLEDACRVGEGIRSAINELAFSFGRRKYRTSVSIGLCAITPEHISSSRSGPGIEHVLVDAAMAASDDARRSGGNRIRVTPSSDGTARPNQERRLQSAPDWVSTVTNALDDDAIRLFMQPIKSATTPDTIIGLEVHSRIDVGDEPIAPSTSNSSPDRSFDSTSIGSWSSTQRAAQFVPAIAHQDIMTRLDRWVVLEVLDWYTHHREQLVSGVMVSINVGGRSIRDASFRQFLLDAVLDVQIKAGSICVEIRAGDVPVCAPEITAFVTTLREHGVRVAIDAVGSDLKTVTQWRECPVDYIKLDSTLVQPCATSDVDLAVLMSISSIGQLQETVVIAGFVEDQETYEAVLRAGVDGVQGYFVAEPVPMHSILDSQPGLRRSRHSAEIHAFPR